MNLRFPRFRRISDPPEPYLKGIGSRPTPEPWSPWYRPGKSPAAPRCAGRRCPAWSAPRPGRSPSRRPRPDGPGLHPSSAKGHPRAGRKERGQAPAYRHRSSTRWLFAHPGQEASQRGHVGKRAHGSTYLAHNPPVSAIQSAILSAAPAISLSDTSKSRAGRSDSPINWRMTCCSLIKIPRSSY